MNYDFIITLLLVLIVYFLYQVAKQLSYITGVRIKFPWGQWDIKRYRNPPVKNILKEAKKENLKN